MSQASITSKSARERLKPRREPYWSRVVKGGYVGFRKSRYGGTWVARWRTADSKQLTQALQINVEAIDPADQFDEASKQAKQWFESLGQNHKAGYTVADAVEDYWKHREINNSKASGRDAKQRLEKHVVPTLGNVPIAKLTKKQVADWHKSLVRVSDDPEDVRKSKDGANRLLSYFKAALNLALQQRDRCHGSGVAHRQSFSGRGTSPASNPYRRADQAAAEAYVQGSFRELMESALLTGGRYGELIAARVEDLDVENGTLQTIRQDRRPSKSI